METRTHKIPIQGTVIYADKTRISGDNNDPISPIDFFELTDFPANCSYRIENVLNIDLKKEEADCVVTAETSFHNWLEGKLTDKTDFTNLKKLEKHKLKRNDIEAVA